MGTSQSTHTILLPVVLSNPKITPTKVEMQAFFRRKVWREMLTYVFKDLSHVHPPTVTYTPERHDIALTFNPPVQLSNHDIAIIKDGFHKGTHAGDPVRVRSSGHWHTMWI